jgi:uncharacterized RmlC-like cupin family protein
MDASDGWSEEDAMAAADRVTRITPSERTEGDQTPGMTREQAIAVPGLWAGLVRTAAHMTTGWHHHAEYETSIYVVSGSLRMESGPGGAEVVDAVAGDFLHVPKGAVHREGNTGDEESELVVIRSGSGPAVINVDGPAPS